jgi:hypothetical protein
MKLAASRTALLVVPLAIVIVAAPLARGLTISINYIAPGQTIPGVGLAQAPPSNLVGGGTLDGVFRAAADVWERAIGDPFTLTLNYGWSPTAGISATAYHQGLSIGGVPTRQTAGSIVFNSAPTRAFFLDPTPNEHEEFGPMTVAAADLGGGAINIRREFAPTAAVATGAIDALSTAIHEIGHALGLSGWPFYNAEVADGDIDVTIAPYAGTSIPVSGSHLAVVGPSLSSTGRPVGYRRVLSDLDVIAVSQVSQFRQYQLPQSADFNADWLVDQLDLTVWSEAFTSAAQADANGDGVTDGADFLMWQRQTAVDAAPGVGGRFAVPEPRAIALAIGPLWLCWAARRRKSAGGEHADGGEGEGAKSEPRIARIPRMWRESVSE